jgi:hypothetical protein
MPIIRPVAAAAAILVALGQSPTVHASSPRFLQAATQADFLKGDVENVSVDHRGQLSLGPITELTYETAAPFLWTLVPAPDGSIFIGTGNAGRVFRIDPQGKGALFFDSSELEVHALAPAPDGGLYVGTSPNGRIYKVDRNGKAATFFEPGEKYIWTLAVDAAGTVFAGTGEKGTVYKITPDGKGAPFYQSKATHVTALAVDRAGSLLVGTESPGRVLRVGADGKGFLLLDSPFQEIRALRFNSKGLLYVAAVNGRAGSTGGAQAAGQILDRAPERTGTEPAGVPVPSVSTEITAIAIGDASTASGSAGSTKDDRRTPKGAIYRVAPDGLWDQMWESREDVPYDMTFDGEGRLIIATGNKGKIYRLEGDPAQPTLIARAAAQQVTALYRDTRGSLHYATANPGKVYRLSSELAPKGTYESEPRDALAPATWGAISWRGTVPAGARVEISTRSGNTETPDDNWSAWSAAYTVPEGSPISSPKARYLQWRATLTGKGQSPVLTSITAAYLQRNVRPQVRAITVYPPGTVFQKPYSSGDPDIAGFDNQTTPDRKLATAAANAQQGANAAPALGRRTYQRGLQTLMWRAEDENEDELAYDVQYRREGETTWKVLRSNMTEPILVWDTTTVPNGTYFVRIVASDAPSNAPDTALTGELDSSAFQIDNLPPQIVVQSIRTEGTKTLVVFDVKDENSPIQRVELSTDGQQWRAVFPVDGIADSRTEHYQVAVDGPLGPRGLSLRASDSMNNVVTLQVDAPGRR